MPKLVAISLGERCRNTAPANVCPAPYPGWSPQTRAARGRAAPSPPWVPFGVGWGAMAGGGPGVGGPGGEEKTGKNTEGGGRQGAGGVRQGRKRRAGRKEHLQLRYPV